MTIAYKTIWRCDRAGCCAEAETINQGDEPPGGWERFYAERYGEKKWSVWITICPAHVADVAAVLPGAFAREAPAPDHDFPGGGLPCSICKLTPDEVPSQRECGGPP